MSDANPQQAPWWQGFFDATYGDVLRRHEATRVEATVDFLVEALTLKNGHRVFDQCCGVGRLAVPLARRGVKVFGLDQSRDYIARAEASARIYEADCVFQVGNALEETPQESCDGAFNWFTSCGYVEDDEINGRMFQQAFAALKPGGWFAVDYVQAARVLRNFQACLVERHTDDDGGEMIVMMETRAAFERGMFEGRWTWIYPDGRREERRLENRLYLPHELMGLLRRAGFADLQLFGSIDGASFDLDSRRCIVVARKPE